MKILTILDKNLRIAMLVAFIFALIYIYPIISADRFYIDDMGRSLDGYLRWGQDGRPLSDIIMFSLSLGSPIVDLSPLNQFLAILVISTTVVLYVSKHIKNASPLMLGVISSLFIVQPFLIENLSYKFDSFPMALSAVLLIIPFLINSKPTISFIISILCITSSLALYQASIGLFIIYSVADVVFYRERSSFEDIKNTTFRILQIILSYLFYSLFIVKHFVTGNYAPEHASMITESKNIIQTLSINLSKIFNYFAQAIEPYNILFIIAFLLIVAFSVIKETREQITCTEKINHFKIAVTIASPFLVFLFSFIHILTLETPVFSARVYISLCGAILFFGILLFRNTGRIISVPLIFILLFAGLINVYTYGNATKAQKHVDNLISASIYQDVNSYNKNFSSVSVSGAMPVARQVTNLWRRFPAIARMIPIYLNSNWTWGGRLLQMNMIKLSLSPLSSEKRETLCLEKPFADRKDYKLYDLDSKLVVAFDKHRCK